jgi:hypothetical protein
MQPTFFPLFPVTFVDGVPACGCSTGDACEDIGKHPASFWSDLSPGEQRRGQAGHGLVTGAKSGLFVLDVDVKPGKNGFDELAKLGPLPETYAVATPSGGRHFYFAHPGKAVRTSGGALGPGLDIRGDGGYVVMPGSPHRNGGTYTVAANLPVAPAPAWLLNWPGLYGAELRPAGENAPTPIGPEHPQWAYRNRLAIEACSSFAPSREDGEGSANLGKIVKRLVWDLELSPELAAERIATIWDPRCTKADGFTPSPWGAEEIERAIANSLRRDLVGGIAPEGFDLGALVRKPTPGPTTERRKTKNPNHRYECAIGDRSNGDSTEEKFENVCAILVAHPSWEGVLQYDAFRDRIFAVDPPIKLAAEGAGWADADADRIVTWFGVHAATKITPDRAFRAAKLVAEKQEYHPVHEYLSALPEASASLLDTFALRAFGLSGALERAMCRRFLIAAVRRVLHPGTKVDTMLVLAGAQGLGKSTFVRALFGEEWTAENIPDLRSEEAARSLTGKWAIEVAELDKLMRADPETSKAFFSRCSDYFRPPYGRAYVDRPRSVVFVGTTNRDDILRDTTGSRRFLILGVQGVDLAWIRENRDQVWAAALEACRAGEPHWLTPEEDALREQASVAWEELDAWHEAIALQCTGRTAVRAPEIFRSLSGTLDKFGKREQARITDTLRRLGCKPGIENQGERRTRMWLVPETLAKAEPPAAELVARAMVAAAKSLERN